MISSFPLAWQKLSWTTTLHPPHPDLIWIRGQSCNPCHKCTLCTLSPSSLTDWCNLGLVHHLQYHLLQTSVSYNSSPNPWFILLTYTSADEFFCVLLVMMMAFQQIPIRGGIKKLFFFTFGQRGGVGGVSANPYQKIFRFFLTNFDHFFYQFWPFFDQFWPIFSEKLFS